jgi:Ser/Thr protein kinase RdoA (MazF antagonist)
MLYQDEFLKRLEAGLRTSLPAWGLAADVSLQRLTISENATFLADDLSHHRKIIFRIHRPAYHTEAEIRAELAWISALVREGVVLAPRSIPTLDGAELVSFDDNGDTRHVVAFQFFPGIEPDTSHGLVKWYEVLGRITARLHMHSRGWRRPPGFVRKLWNFNTIIGFGPKAHWGDWRAAPGLTAEGRAVLERVEAKLRSETDAYGCGEDRFGLIHCDMRAANLLVDGDKLAVIDFDDCGFSWFGYDFAASVSFIEHEPFLPELKAAWLTGYRAVGAFDSEHEAALPMFVMLRRLQLTAWIGSHAETPTAQQVGEAYTFGTVELGRLYLDGVKT